MRKNKSDTTKIKSSTVKRTAINQKRTKSTAKHNDNKKQNLKLTNKKVNKKKQKKQRSLLSISIIITSCLFVVFLGCCILLQSNSILLSQQLIKIERKNDKLSIDNKNLQLELDQLSSKTRITEIALANGYQIRSENLVSVVIK